MFPKVWLASVALLLAASFAQGQPAFEIAGFHSRMTFSQALERASELGLDCEQSIVAGRLRARCTYPTCPEGAECEQSTEAAALTAADQPVSTTRDTYRQGTVSEPSVFTR